MTTLLAVWAALTVWSIIDIFYHSPEMRGVFLAWPILSTLALLLLAPVRDRAPHQHLLALRPNKNPRPIRTGDFRSLKRQRHALHQGCRKIRVESRFVQGTPG